MTERKRKYFGTDGIRGKANVFPMTSEMAFAIAIAAVQVLKNPNKKSAPQVVIGKDTRRSGGMIESAMISGFNAAGADVISLGVLPTPATALSTKSIKADFGVMISASHNPFYDNGIKFFDDKGHKLPNETELEIETIIDEIVTEKIKRRANKYLVDPVKVGQFKKLESIRERYVEFVKNIFPEELNLEGLRVVLDCANGAGHIVAPTVLRELGAKVYTIGAEPDGLNINEECGSTAPADLCKKVIEKNADIGIALDGDADRVVIVNEKGEPLQGDITIALITKKMMEEGTLKGEGVAVTSMSNLAFEQYVTNDLGLKVVRADVGDKYVFEALLKYGFNIGGEESGHIIMLDHGTTGDGLCSGLKILSILAEERAKNPKVKFSEIASLFTPMPQILKNAEFDKEKANPLEVKEIQDLIAKTEKDLEGKGRLLIRKSGTQPLIRVMAEGRDKKEITKIVNMLIEKILEANK